MRWDSFNYWSRILDFGISDNNNNLVLANEGSSNVFAIEVYEGGFGYKNTY